MKRINPQSLICMDDHAGKGLEVDLAYAFDDNLLFGERIYRPDARLWLYEDLAKIVLKAAEAVNVQGYIMVLYDGLRTVEAQEAMAKTQRSLDNPHWTQGEPRLLSPPGAGAHPRGMAIDVSLKDTGGTLLDMGTPFDFLAEDATAAHNPAHREYKGHSADITANRKILDKAMLGAAEALGLPLIGLPAEWWDFRMPADIYGQYEPLSDADLPPKIRMM